MTYGTYGSRQDLWEDSKYTNVKSDFMWMLTLCSKKKRLTCCEKMWSMMQTGCLCKKLRGHRISESSRKVHREVYLPSVTSPILIWTFSHAGNSKYISHIQLKTCICFSQSLQLTKSKSPCSKVLLTHWWSLMSNCSWMPNVGEVRSNLMPSSCTNTSGRGRHSLLVPLTGI